MALLRGRHLHRVISSAAASAYEMQRFECRTGGEPVNSINLISRDSRGTVWILTDTGLFRHKQG